MPKIPESIEISRRALLTTVAIGAVSLSAGYALGHEKTLDNIMPFTHTRPLAPESGEAGNELNIAWLPPTVSRWRQPLQEAAAHYDIDPNLLAIVMLVESGGNPKASSGEAHGLMQITPDRGKDIATKFMSPAVQHYDLFDARTSIAFGAANIRHLIDEFGDPSQGPSWDRTVQLVAAGYNGGEGAANQFKDKGLTSLNGETYAYTRYVATMWRERRDDKSFAFYYWSVVEHGDNLLKAAAKYKLPPAE